MQLQDLHNKLPLKFLNIVLILLSRSLSSSNNDNSSKMQIDDEDNPFMKNDMTMNRKRPSFHHQMYHYNQLHHSYNYYFQMIVIKID